MQFSNVIFTMYEIDMQTLNRQRSNGVEIWRYAFKIGSQQQFHLALERVVSGFIGVQPRLRQFQYQSRFVDLYPLNAAFCQFCQHLLINRQNVVQQAQAIKLFTFHFTQPQVGNRPQQHGLDLVAQRQRLVHFLQQLRPGQFELLAFNELRHHVVIVGIKPFGHFRCRRRFASRCTSTTNTEQGVDIYRTIVVLVTRRNVTQQQAGGQDMIVPGKIAHRQQVDTRLLLLIPVTSTQFTPYRQQFFTRGVPRPITLLRFFQLATQANARETEGVIKNCHYMPLMEFLVFSRPDVYTSIIGGYCIFLKRKLFMPK